MPLARRCRKDIVFHTKRLAFMWAIDTMYGQVNYLDGNQYAQMFSNGTYFAKIYPIYNKADTGQSLKTFVMELGVPEEMTVDV